MEALVKAPDLPYELNLQVWFNLDYEDALQVWKDQSKVVRAWLGMQLD